MGTVTPASLELSLRNCSISSASSPPLDQQTSAADAETPQLGFHASPCQWEQCINFKTGEIYYINRRTGKKVKDDPRKETETSKTDISSEEEEDDSEKRNTSPPPPSTTTPPSIDDFNYEEDVLVVAGCKSCLMYFMLPKTTDECPKCCSNLLLHFDQPEK
ncbi:hypothetical protein AAC387_Pa08g2288 [Persea americana]